MFRSKGGLALYLGAAVGLAQLRSSDIHHWGGKK